MQHSTDQGSHEPNTAELLLSDCMSTGFAYAELADTLCLAARLWKVGLEDAVTTSSGKVHYSFHLMPVVGLAKAAGLVLPGFYCRPLC